MRESIAGYADGIVERSVEDGSVATVAGELASIRSLIEGSEDLLRVLSDPGVPAPARRAVVNDLFSGRVSAASLRLVSFLVDADKAPEILDDIVWLEARAAAARDGLVAVGEGPLGRHAASERLLGYAIAVLEDVPSTGDPGTSTLGEIEDELFRFLRVVEGAAALRSALTDRDVAARARHALVLDLLSGKATSETTRLAGYATTVGRPRDYLTLLDELVTRVAEESNRRVADVRCAVALDDEQRRRLGEALGRVAGRHVEVRVDVDRRVLAGFVATIGDTVVDGSARHRLDQLKERLVMPEATIDTAGPTIEGDQPR